MLYSEKYFARKTAVSRLAQEEEVAPRPIRKREQRLQYTESKPKENLRGVKLG